MQEQAGILSNLWWSTVANDFSVTILLAATGIMTALKIIAKVHPNNKSDEIICLIQGWLFGFPGLKQQALDESKDKRISAIETETLSPAAKQADATDKAAEEKK